MATVIDPNPKPASPPLPPGDDTELKVGDTVIYRPNDREQYPATVVAVLEYTNSQGIASWVRVPSKAKALAVGYGPHWHEENPVDPNQPTVKHAK
jgi:hypothetical protein